MNLIGLIFIKLSASKVKKIHLATGRKKGRKGLERKIAESLFAAAKLKLEQARSDVD